MAKLTQKAVMNALKKVRGNISAAARALEVTRHAVQQRVHKDPEMQQFIIDCRQTLVDDSEDVLGNAVRSGDVSAAKYVLSTIGKDRGYGQTTTVAGDQENPILLHHSGNVSNDPSIDAADALFAESIASEAGDQEGEDEAADAGIHTDGGPQQMDHGRDPGDAGDSQRQPPPS